MQVLGWILFGLILFSALVALIFAIFDDRTDKEKFLLLIKMIYNCLVAFYIYNTLG
jgi:hypothetical protein